QASDEWNHYQAKKNRQYLYEACADLVESLAKEPDVRQTVGVGDPPPNQKSQKNASQLAQDWRSNASKWKKDTDGIEKKARSFEAQADALREKAREKGELVDEKQEEATEKAHESHHVHTRANWLDYGHLGIELALVLCSIAVLTKQRSFWYSGIV